MSTDSLVTIEQLGRPPYRDRPCELVDGRIVDVSPAHGGHASVASRVLHALVAWATARGADRIFSAETGFVLRRDPDTVRAPDVAFLREGRAVPAHAFVEGAPDVAIEVLSPDASVREVARKVRDYLGARATQVWTLDPEDRTLTVHRAGGRSEALGEGDTLIGEDALSGFRLAVRTLFGE